MLPLMLNLYVSRLKEAGAPLHPRIDSELANHLGYVDGALKGREFFVGQSLTGADIQMSFVGEMAKVFEKLGPYPNLAAWLARMHARPAFQRSSREGRGVPVCVSAARRPGRERDAGTHHAAALRSGTWPTPSFRRLPAYGPRLHGPAHGPGRLRGPGTPSSPPYLA